MKTSKDLYALTGITRKQLRMYIKKKLIIPVTKTESGLWQYEDQAVNQIRSIHRYQRVGFTLTEIRIIQESEEFDLEAALVRKMNEMKSRQKDIDVKILAAADMLNLIRREKESNED